MTDKKNNTGVDNSGNRNSGNYNSGYCNSGDCNSGNYNSGDCNSGYRNSGWFNTNEPKARFFNQETDITLTEFYESGKMPDQSAFPLNRWIDKSEMTKEEKDGIEGWKTMGGCLKTLDYQEAWKIFWEETDEENRQKFLNLPNFDQKIFKEITGIDIDETDNKTEEAIKLLKDRGYRIVKK